MGLCCENCFESEAARAFVRAQGAREGECDYCGNNESTVIEAYELKELFLPLVEIYKSAEDRMHFDHQMEESGHVYYDTLAELICQDWDVFKGAIDFGVLNNLLDDILHGDVDPSHWHGFVYPADHAWIRCEDCVYGTKPENTWHWFASHLKSERRFIIDEGPEREIVRPERWIGGAIDRLEAYSIFPAGSLFYRGRIGYQNSHDPRSLEPLPANKMGAPPASLAKASRASSEGIPALYVALTKKVAVAEAGRFPGAIVSIREIQAIEDLKLVDLAKVPELADPLGVSDLAHVDKYRRLLFQLNYELSKPIHPDDSTLEYIPTQYLSEAIKVAGYDGICYRSAMRAPGTNIVIFDPEKVQVTERGEVLAVTGIKMDIQVARRPY